MDDASVSFHLHNTFGEDPVWIEDANGNHSVGRLTDLSPDDLEALRSAKSVSSNPIQCKYDDDFSNQSLDDQVPVDDYVDVRNAKGVNPDDFIDNVLRWPVPIQSIIQDEDGTIHVKIRVYPEWRGSWEDCVKEHSVRFLEAGADADFINPLQLIPIPTTGPYGSEGTRLLYLNYKPDGTSIWSRYNSKINAN